MKTPIPEVASAELVTVGRIQHLVMCPRCGATHRHLDAGLRRAPCGARYVVITTRKEPAP